VDAPCTAAGTRTTPVLPVSGSYTLLVDPSHLETGGASFAITLA
jgi:hypothetical protein